VSGQDAALKSGMKGALIYNTNENTCIGIHTWNGDYWERIAANFVEAQGKPLTSSNAAIAFGGDVVNFTASLPGAKSYRWYVSENDGDYKYLGITTTNTWSKDFPTGKYKLKVIMDDCHSLTESNELPFAPASISPNFGSLDGGNTIYLYGDFPYASTEEYVQSGLVAHFDGINNTGEGDKLHSYDATEWKDLTNNLTLGLTTTPLQNNWNSNSFEIKGLQYWTTSNLNANIPLGGSSRTMELIFTTPSTSDKIFKNGWNPYCGFAPSVVTPGSAFNMSRQNTMAATPLNGHFADLSFSAIEAAQLGLNDLTSLHTFVITYANGISDTQNTNAYVDGTKAVDVQRQYSGGSFVNVLNTCGNSTSDCSFSIGGTNASASDGYKYSSCRIYNRVLTEAEIQHNAVLDQIRYLTPPTVTIDGKNCTEVVVLSPHFLMCKVPPSNTLGPKDVTVNGFSYGNVYEYVHPTDDFYVSNISPIIGEAGDVLKLTGNKLGASDISKIEVGGNDCPIIPATQTSTYCECTLQAHSAGEVDITIITSSKTYGFAKVFEYK
jgi:hypothetical protein